VARNGSPPWREDDKDGHYIFELGDDLTPRCNPTFLLPKNCFDKILKIPFKFL
jgi:dual-specificity kinase